MQCQVLYDFLGAICPLKTQKNAKKENRRLISIPESLASFGVFGGPFLSGLSVQSVAKLLLLFLAEFLESGIAAQRIPERIEPKKRRRNRVLPVNVAIVRHV
jgi:hypothetical protein